MKCTYEIIGINKEGDEVRLFVKKHIPVTEKSTMDSVMSNPMAFVESMKLDAIKTRIPQQISIDYDYWKENKWNIGDLIIIEVMSYEA